MLKSMCFSTFSLAFMVESVAAYTQSHYYTKCLMGIFPTEHKKEMSSTVDIV